MHAGTIEISCPVSRRARRRVIGRVGVSIVGLIVVAGLSARAQVQSGVITNADVAARVARGDGDAAIIADIEAALAVRFDTSPAGQARLRERGVSDDAIIAILARVAASGAMTVRTDPPAVTVVVNGQSVGETPLDIHLPAGEHRITLVREGYLDNSRRVTLEAGEEHRVDVTLTPSPAAAAESGGGLGRGAILGIVGAGAAAGVGVAVAGGDGGSGPGTFSPNPGVQQPSNGRPVAAFTVSPGRAGMAALTEYRFDATGSSDPNNDRLTYSWRFGDGSNASGMTATHLYEASGTFSVALTVSDGSTSATTTRQVAVAPNLHNARFVGNLRFRVSGCAEPSSSTMTLDGLYQYDDGSFAGGFRDDQERCNGRPTFSDSLSGRISGRSDYVCPCDIVIDFSDSGARWRGTLSGGSDVITIDNQNSHNLVGTTTIALNRQ